MICKKSKYTEQIQEQINPESMGSQPSRTQVTEQQPVVSLKSKSVFLQISLINFDIRRKGHVHKQEVFDTTFIAFKKLFISDFYCTSQGCQQSCHASQNPEWSFFAWRSCFFCTQNPTSTVSYFLSLAMFVLPPFQEAMQWEVYSVTIIS